MHYFPRTTWTKNIHDNLSSLDLGIYGEAVSRAPSVEHRVSTAPVSRAPQLIITNYLG